MNRLRGAAASLLRLPGLRRLAGHTVRTDLQVGVRWCADGIAIAVLSGDGTTLHFCDWRAAETPQERESALFVWVTNHHLRDVATTIVLDEGDYQLQQLDLPGIPDEELANAARFRVKDLSRIPLAEAVVAAYRLHSDRATDGGSMVSIAIAEQARVEALVAATAAAGLSPQRVVHREVAMIGLALQTPDPGSRIAQLLIDHSTGVVTLSRDDQLYLARGHHYGTARLAEAEVSEREGVILELQRSLDYHDSQLSTARAAQVLLLPTSFDAAPLLDELNENLPVPAAQLSLEHIVELAAESEAEALLPPSPEVQARTILAVGAALLPPLPSGALLYRPQPREIDWLGAEAIAAYTGLWAALCTTVAGVLLYQAAQIERQQAELEEERTEWVANVERLEEELAAHRPSTRLARRHAALEQELQLRRRFADKLERMEARQLEGFSPLLEALARGRVEGLWLTHFERSGEALYLRGRAQKPRYVAEFLEQLAEEPTLQGADFDGFEIIRPAEEMDEAAEGRGGTAGEAARGAARGATRDMVEFRISTRRLEQQE
ncbi:PilN domain-containing protein [Halorhodospira abdelmalekii]|uniref:PilN domain-containing protein n=1 Tax=Halorhodospira abdelmalekii TaxID=421629 RepID=UPI0019068BA6